MSCVDVIVPCYKYGHYLGQCVESVLSQSHQDLRVLIIDDCSPDHTEEVARALVARDGRVTYRRHRANRGHIATYNEGLDWTDGDYVLLLSADDLLTPGSLRRAVGLLDGNPELGMSHGRGIIFTGEVPSLPYETGGSLDSTILSSESFIESFCQAGTNRVITPTAVVRTWLQKRLGGYRADLPHTCDMEMWMRIAAHSRIGFIENAQAYYRKHANNMSNYYQAVLALQQDKLAFRALFDQHGRSIPDAARLRELANHRIAEKAFWMAYHAFDDNDVATSRALLGFAALTSPVVKTWRSYSRLRLKLALGSRVWDVIRPVWDRLGAAPDQRMTTDPT